jgi:hypothetical protein
MGNCIKLPFYSAETVLDPPRTSDGGENDAASNLGAKHTSAKQLFKLLKRREIWNEKVTDMRGESALSGIV